MKRILLSLFVLLATVMATFAQKPFYVYLNDGSFKGFLTSQIDSMSISRIDADGVEHSDYVMQEFWTPDSVYRIPIAQIDSIGFTTPETQFQPDAINVADSLAQYVISADTTHIYLQLSTPKHLIPSVGEKLGYPTVDNLFPYGFSGKVQTVTTRSSDIELSCEQIRLDEVFETLYLTMVTERKGETQAKGGNPLASLVDGVYIPIPTIHLPFPKIEFGSEISRKTEKNEKLALNYSNSVSLDIDNTFDVTMFVVVNKDMGAYFQISSIAHHDLTLSGSFSGNLSYGEDKKISLLTQKKNLAYGVCLYFEPGWFYNAAVSGSLQGSTTFHFVSSVSFDCSSLGQSILKPNFKVRPNGVDSNITASIDGTLALGLYCEGGFTFIDEAIDKAAYRFEAGGEFAGTCALLSSDFEKTAQSTELYQRLKTSEITLSPYIAHSLVFGIGSWDVKPLFNKILYPPVWKRTLVPTFSDTKVDVSSVGKPSANVTSEMSGNCLLPITVGYKLFDNDNNEVDSYISPTKYSNKSSVLEYKFEDLEKNSTYIVYPMVDLFGHDVLAVPEKEFKTEEMWPKVTDVEITDFGEGSYYNEGIAYDYKFNVATTVEIKDLEGVADWGYVYKDPNGNIKHVSLMGHNSPYVDTSYAYYRNETKSTVCLYGYVKYEGDSEYYYDEPKEWPLVYYTCPDNNHPHAIDLGLPSGTKWACCNSGSVDGEQHVEQAISTVWGGGWSIPTLTQLQELKTYCRATWVGGTRSGLKFISPNGNILYLDSVLVAFQSNHFVEICEYLVSSPAGPYLWEATSNGGEHTTLITEGMRFSKAAIRLVCP